MLLEEFPDVSISKIRFLESQGLIDPERTPSGYRKFYDADVDRLRVILREQRQNFLPLRVIRDRLESGQIDKSGPMTPPRGLRNVTVLDSGNDSIIDETGDLVVPAGTVGPTAHHPAAQARVTAQHAIVAPPPTRTEPAPGSSPPPPAPPPPPPPRQVQAAPAAPRQSSPSSSVESRSDSYDVTELCARAGISKAQLADLVSFGLISGTGTGANALYSTSDVAIATAAAGFLARGVDARHLRHWRRSAEIEADLFEQLVVPLLSQRNPHSKQQAATSLRELSVLGGGLRAAILAAALQHHLET